MDTHALHPPVLHEDVSVTSGLPAPDRQIPVLLHYTNAENAPSHLRRLIWM